MVIWVDKVLVINGGVGPRLVSVEDLVWMCLDQLPLARLRFDLEVVDGVDVEAYKGDMLRRALLWWLSAYWCTMPERCRGGCRQPGQCLFGRLCQPLVSPAWPAPMQKLMGSTPPPAYVIWDMQDRRCQLIAGDVWSFELTLVGRLALRHIPAVLAAVQQGAERGIGLARLRSRIRRVTALTAADSSDNGCRLAEQTPGTAHATPVWQSHSLDKIALGYPQAVAWAHTHSQPVHAVSLRYLSPTQIKEHSQWVTTPHFSAVMRAVVRRLRLLSLVHGAGEWPQTEFGPLLDLAEQVRLDHYETHWAGYTRSSQKSDTHQMQGFLGQAWYRGPDLRPFLPALWLGQWLHIGKWYVLGNGRYTLEQVGA